MKQKNINLIICILSLIVVVISCMYKDGSEKYIYIFSGVSICLVFILLYKLDIYSEKRDVYVTGEITNNIMNGSEITEIALLNENNIPITYWQMYGKSSMVIGRDTGENCVDINLLNTVYGSTIDVEHAVLNYSGGNWYLEDNASKNGVSVVKNDGKKYRLNNAKPCLVEKGDIIYISLERLKLC